MISARVAKDQEGMVWTYRESPVQILYRVKLDISDSDNQQSLSKIVPGVGTYPFDLLDTLSVTTLASLTALGPSISAKKSPRSWEVNLEAICETKTDRCSLSTSSSNWTTGSLGGGGGGGDPLGPGPPRGRGGPSYIGESRRRRGGGGDIGGLGGSEPLLSIGGPGGGGRSSLNRRRSASRSRSI